MIWYILGVLWFLSAIVCRWYVRKDIELKDWENDFNKNVVLFSVFFPIINTLLMIFFFFAGVGWHDEYTISNLLERCRDYLFEKLI